MTVSFRIPTIRTARLVLRAFQPEDYPAYHAYYTGERTRAVGGPLPEHRVFERFCAMIGHWHLRGFGRYAISFRSSPTATAIGHVGPMKQAEDSETEMTWTLWDEEHTGHGYATEAARAVLEHLFNQGWSHVGVYIDRDNAASIRVAKRLGAVEDRGAIAPEWNPRARRFVLKPGDVG